MLNPTHILDQIAADAETRVALAFDPQEYMAFLADCDWTDAQKAEFIAELWKIIVGFVDLGFGIHPVQQAVEKSALETDSPRMVSSGEHSDNLLTTAATDSEGTARRSDS